jgi:hypothetical protein
MSKFEDGPDRRRHKGQFQPGTSGNPGGRPREIVEVAAAARERTAEALETLTTIMRDKEASAAARVSAAIALLERGWGKAPATVTLLRDNVDMKDLSDAELMVIAAGGRNGSGSSTPGTEEDSGQPH